MATTWKTATDDWVEVPDDNRAFFQKATELAWGDGLPVIAPTAERIEEHLAYTDLHADEVLGTMAVREGAVTPVRVAANAVLAGCPPEAFPVVLTTAIALLEPEFNLTGVTATTHPCSPLVVVHGPIVDEIGMNSNSGAFGPGNVANATIGRAVRLMLMNIGGARPGAADRATHGQPSKYSYCAAENAAESPWQNYTEQLGLGSDVNAVTIYAGENPHNVNDHINGDAVGILHTIGLTLRNGGCNNVHFNDGEIILALGPEHAASIASSGFTVEDVQFWLYENCRLTLHELSQGNMFHSRLWPQWMMAEEDPTRLLPVVRHPDRLRVMVIGGPGKHSLVIPGFGATRAVTKVIETTSA